METSPDSPEPKQTDGAGSRDGAGWTENELARIAVANQFRRGLHALVGGEHDTNELYQLATSLENTLRPLEGAAPIVKELGKWSDPTVIEEPPDNTQLFSGANRPVSGPANPWSIPLEVYRRGHRAVTTVELGVGFEGAPDRSHGGVVSAIFDDLCGFVLSFERSLAFTAYLTINYHAGTPIGRPITFSSWADRREGRKLFLKGECRAGADEPDGELLTSCEALFITIEGFGPEPDDT